MVSSPFDRLISSAERIVNRCGSVPRNVRTASGPEPGSSSEMLGGGCDSSGHGAWPNTVLVVSVVTVVGARVDGDVCGEVVGAGAAGEARQS